MSLYGDLPQSKDGKDSVGWGGALKPPPRKPAPSFGPPPSVLRAAAAAGRGGGRVGPGPIGGGRGRGAPLLSTSLLSAQPEGYDASPLLGAAAASTSGQSHPSTPQPQQSHTLPSNTSTNSALSIFAVNGQAVQDEYDPARPNDYEEVIKERDRRKREAAEEVQRQAQLREYEAEREARQRELEEQAKAALASVAAAQAVAARLAAAAPPGASDGGPAAPPGSFGDPSQQRDAALNVSGEEAYLRRGRAGAGLGSMAAGGANAADAFAETRGMGLAQKLLEKMGWKEGDGLGRNRHGMTTPLVAQKYDKRSGVIVNAEPSDFKRLKSEDLEKSAARPPGAAVLGKPTRVICMRNMVGRGEVDEHLEDEVGNELTKYGTVSSVLIFEVTAAGYVPEEAVRIFVQFERMESAVKALIDLTGRFFGGRQVRCSFFSEDRFDKTDLAPAAGEFENA